MILFDVNNFIIIILNTLRWLIILFIYIYLFIIRLAKIHSKNYIHHDLHSGNIFSYDTSDSCIGDLGLCQQVVDKKDNPNKIFGVVPYLAPEVLSKNLLGKINWHISYLIWWILIFYYPTILLVMKSQLTFYFFIWIRCDFIWC